MITENDGKIIISGNGEKEVKLEGGYYLESQLELFEYRMNDEQLPEDQRRYFKEKHDYIMEKINMKKLKGNNYAIPHPSGQKRCRI